MSENVQRMMRYAPLVIPLGAFLFFSSRAPDSATSEVAIEEEKKQLSKVDAQNDLAYKAATAGIVVADVARIVSSEAGEVGLARLAEAVEQKVVPKTVTHLNETLTTHRHFDAPVENEAVLEEARAKHFGLPKSKKPPAPAEPSLTPKLADGTEIARAGQVVKGVEKAGVDAVEIVGEKATVRAAEESGAKTLGKTALSGVNKVLAPIDAGMELQMVTALPTAVAQTALGCYDTAGDAFLNKEYSEAHKHCQTTAGNQIAGKLEGATKTVKDGTACFIFRPGETVHGKCERENLHLTPGQELLSDVVSGIVTIPTTQLLGSANAMQDTVLTALVPKTSQASKERNDTLAKTLRVFSGL